MTNIRLLWNLIGLYVPQEQEFIPDLEGTLSVLVEKGLLTSWQTHNVLEHEVTIPDASILLLLISPSFIASEFFLQEHAHILKKHEDFELCGIALMMRYTLWYNFPLAKLPTLPRNHGRGHKPVAAWRNREYVFEEDLPKGLISIIEAFEQEQIYRISEQFQKALDTIRDGQHQALLAHGVQHLFEMGERLEPLLPEQVLDLFEALAELTREDQSEFSVHCAQRAASIRQRWSKQHEHGTQQ